MNENASWELSTDHGFLNYGTISKLCRAGFVIFGIVFVSRNFEVGRKLTSVLKRRPSVPYNEANFLSDHNFCSLPETKPDN